MIADDAEYLDLRSMRANGVSEGLGPVMIAARSRTSLLPAGCSLQGRFSVPALSSCWVPTRARLMMIDVGCSDVLELR